MQRPTEKLIGQRIREARERSKRPQRSIAVSMSALGYPWSQNMQTRIENGERGIRLSEAVVLADLLGVSVESFYGDGPASTDHGPAIRELLGLQAQVAKRIEELS